MSSKSRRRSTGTGLLAALAFGAAGPGHAATIAVTSTADDDNGCTLRNAVAAINAGSSAVCTNTGDAFGIVDAIDLSSLTGAIHLTEAAGGALQVSQPLTITGPGSGTLLIVGSGQSRVLTVASGAALTIGGVTLTGGSANYASGGAIFGDTGSELYIVDSVVSGNAAVAQSNPCYWGPGGYGGYGYGGGYCGTVAGTGEGGGVFGDAVTIAGSTITGNNAGGQAGAVRGNHLTITGSTIANNTGNMAVVATAELTLANSTLIAEDTNAAASPVYTITNSTIVDPNDQTGSSLLVSDPYTGSQTITNSIIAVVGFGGTCNFAPHPTMSHVIGTDPYCGSGVLAMPYADMKLSSTLADNGGATQTLALLAGSPAIGAGDPAACAAAPIAGVDQRGQVRGPSHCDIGAYEYSSPDGAGGGGGGGGPSAQTITFLNTPAVMVAGQASVRASASSGLAVDLSVDPSSTGCTAGSSSVSAGVTKLIVKGTVAGQPCLINAAQAGDASFLPASGTASITIKLRPQLITDFVVPVQLYVGNAALVGAVGGGSGNPVVFSSATPSTCAVSGDALTALAAGPCTVTASQAGNSAYAAAKTVTRGLVIKTGSVREILSGHAALSTSANLLRFGCPAASSGQQQVKLSNNSRQEVRLRLAAPDGYAVDAAIASAPSCSDRLAAGASCYIGLAATDSAQNHTGRLSILATGHALSVLLLQECAMAGAIQALAPADVSALTPAQLATLPADILPLSALSPDQISQLSAERLAALGAADIASFSAEQFARLRLGSLSIAQITALTDAQLGALTGPQVATLSPEQAAALSPDQLRLLSLGALRALPLSALGADQLHVLPITALAPAALGTLSAAQVAALTPAQLGQVSEDQIGQIASWDAFAAMSPDQIRALPIRLMFWAYLNRIPPAQFAYVNVADIAPSQFPRLDPALFAVIDVFALSSAQLQALTHEQLHASLTVAKCSDVANPSSACFRAIQKLRPSQIPFLPLYVMAKICLQCLSLDQLGATTPAQRTKWVADARHQALLRSTSQGQGFTLAQLSALYPDPSYNFDPYRGYPAQDGTVFYLPSDVQQRLIYLQQPLYSLVNLSAYDFSAYPPAQIQSLTIKGITDEITKDGCSASVLSLMSPAQMRVLSLDQVRAMGCLLFQAPAETLAAMNVVQRTVWATGLDPASLSDAQKITLLVQGGLSSSQVATFDLVWLNNVSPGLYQRMAASSVQAMSQSQLNALNNALISILQDRFSPAQVGQLTPSQVSALDLGKLTPDARAPLLSGIVAQLAQGGAVAASVDLHFMSSSFLLAMTYSEYQALNGTNDARVWNIFATAEGKAAVYRARGEFFAKMTKAQVTSLSGLEFLALTTDFPDALAKVAQLLTAKQLMLLNSAQFNGLLPKLSTQQVGALANSGTFLWTVPVAGMTADQLGILPAGTVLHMAQVQGIDAFTPDMLTHLSGAAVAQLVSGGELKATQIAAILTRLPLDAITALDAQNRRVLQDAVHKLQWTAINQLTSAQLDIVGKYLFFFQVRKLSASQVDGLNDSLLHAAMTDVRNYQEPFPDLGEPAPQYQPDFTGELQDYAIDKGLDAAKEAGDLVFEAAAKSSQKSTLLKGAGKSLAVAAAGYQAYLTIQDFADNQEKFDAAKQLQAELDAINQQIYDQNLADPGTTPPRSQPPSFFDDVVLAGRISNGDDVVGEIEQEIYESKARADVNAMMKAMGGWRTYTSNAIGNP